MQSVSPQLTLGFSLQAGSTFANFYVGNTNLEIVAALKKMASGHGEHYVYLSGESGTGRSHLLQACVHEAHFHQKRAAYLPLRELTIPSDSRPSITPDILQGFESFSLVCLDDIQVIANQPDWEEALFHLFNRIRDVNGRLLLAANDIPIAIGLRLPDLISRLTWGVIYSLHPLADDEKLTVLITCAHERGIHLSEEVGRYMLTHCPRHMRTLCAALDALDDASLAAQRRLTIPFVKKVLQI